MAIPERQPLLSIPPKLPLLAVRDTVIFPYMVLPLAVGREKSIRATEAAMSAEHLIFLVAQKKMEIEDPQRDDLYEVGTVGEVLQLLKMPDGTLKILVEGVTRAKIVNSQFLEEKKYVEVEITIAEEKVIPSIELEALMRQVASLFDQYIRLNRRMPFESGLSLTNIVEPGRLADIIAAHLLIKTPEKQKILETSNPQERLEKLISILNSEIEILTLEKKIQNRVRSQIEKTQKEYYLTEQMKAIQKELRQKDDFAKEIDELREKVKKTKMSKEGEEEAMRELSRLEKMAPFSPEATVIRTYIDWLIALPWAIKTKDNLDLKRAQEILEEDHYGLEKAKERILEYLAVCKRTKKLKGPIFCFVGPPGVGKTSLARSIARALGRKFVRMSLGGVRDEAEIRGHRRTYIGALPGRIIQSIRKAKSKNPVFLLDEVDKMGTDWRGDPAAALLEVLDPEQNNTFMDHYLDVEFDLSDVMFITTANTLYAIPPSLQDRLETIRFPGYTTEEKIEIARRYLIPKQTKENGLDQESLKITLPALKRIIHEYTQEAGVRNLEREIANACRKVAKELVLNPEKKEIEINQDNVEKYLGIPKFHREKVTPNEIGVATGLAWTEVGGSLLAIEVTVMKGKGKLTLTGKLGEVMQESAQAALSYIRSIAKKLSLKEDFFKDLEIHIHLPEGAIPKDGPSAGIAMATALASVLTKRAVKKDVAMTGEITLRGRILPIGGFKEKILAAFREGIKTVIFPEGNKKDLEEIPKEIQKKLKLIPAKSMDEILGIALEPLPEKKARKMVKPVEIYPVQPSPIAKA
ncbi:MAG TPA: endopeptidase La [Elusimicrobia bacterium]|jgi:ATP-dependent Lon protease|nr:endopeptidase La [Elusimicrobiota bacterium]